MPQPAAAPGPLPVVAQQGDFDEDTLPPARSADQEAVNAHGGLILDAGNITFGDSTFLRLLLATHQETDLRIANSSPTVTRLISVVGAHQVLNIHPNAEAARSA
ncbi:STAS domain-containing protein [Streptomyces microflavus]|uniref:STAS domain-containing protein n=1 Tax=Streptomyces microflavus TaxID=1919 RepID=UPI003811B93A